ncbi:DUF821 domain protein [Aspergillus steynii IBT 23096]|uniref:DUF821 domain protein n=1 Tax=Aspergillus steynii IBT 23096 TaxID=1392250 RepID=A0A2I2GEK7_9EURO|nr:DUF821 domain protein [Aspergillus steynii IBT 23096]PLB51292.1 DUF821 domain protein [Aspergillus steynii IBT 23096]
MFNRLHFRGLYVLYLLACALVGLIVWGLWFGVNSDRDNVPTLLNQLIPAGHCACETSLEFKCDTCLHCSADAPTSSPEENRKYNPLYDAHNLSLSDAQCQGFFPGLFEDINRAQGLWESRGGITTEDLDDIEFVDSMARAAIVDGQLYFVFSVEDRLDDVAGPDYPIWILARKPDEESVWLMPDFGFWSWNNGHTDRPIGPYNAVVDRVVRREKDEFPWDEKEAKLVWRGKLSFAAKMRRGLLEAARGKPWGDVKELDWGRKDNFMTMEDHCRYRYIAHVEGRSYSASLKYRQACMSVVIAHKLQFIQHHHYLLVSSGPDQNFVEVERDFTDLSDKMQHLLDDPALSERIANNSVATFRDRYLTPAAETCYWRKLLDGWTSASPKISQDVQSSTIADDGLRFESFLLLDSKAMMDFSGSYSA